MSKFLAGFWFTQMSGLKGFYQNFCAAHTQKYFTSLLNEAIDWAEHGCWRDTALCNGAKFISAWP